MSLYFPSFSNFLARQSSRGELCLRDLAAGIFSRYLYAIAVVSITNLAPRKADGVLGSTFARAPNRRVYAAYMRFLLLLCLCFHFGLSFFGYVAPLLSVAPNSHALGAHDFSVLSIYTLPLGRFLIAACRRRREGPVLRKAGS